MMPASHEVFKIAELLEMILLLTSYIDLFILQRVDKQFQTTILDSPALQRKMLDLDDSFHKAHQTLEFLNHFKIHPFNVSLDSGPHWDQPAGSDLSLNANPTILNLILGVDDGTGTLGWQGASTVHQHGSWEKLGWDEQLKRGVWKVRANAHSKRWRHAYTKISMEGTMGDLFVVLRKLRERCAREDAVVTNDPFWGFREVNAVQGDREMCEEARGD